MVLADEPTGALDSVTSQEVIELFKGFSERGLTTLIVTHEEDISKMTSHVIRLKDGLIENGES